MMWHSVAGILGATLLLLIQGTDPERSYGFYGYPWGTQFSQLEQKFDLKLITRYGSRSTFASNIHRLEDAEVDECQLEFVRTKLAGVILLTQGAENSSRVLTYLKKHLGDGQRVAPTAYTWMSDGIHVSYDIDSYGDGYVYWYSLPHQQE